MFDDQLLIISHLDIDECLSNPCQHNGRCIDGVSGYTCKCRAGYGGKYLFIQ